MKRPVYHFLTVACDVNGRRSVVTLPGQTFGFNPVPGYTLIKDRLPSRPVAKARRQAAPGDILFTTTLRKTATALWADDVHPLHGHGCILYQDVEEAYASYLKTIQQPEQ